MEHKIENLDEVLAFMNGPHGRPFIIFDGIEKWFRENKRWENEAYYLMKILDKLEKDGYIDFVIKEGYKEVGPAHGAQKVQIKQYTITWDGIYFLKMGGYINKEWEIVRLKNVENGLQNVQVRMVRLTRWIAVATVAAALYYLLEIYKEIRMPWPK